MASQIEQQRGELVDANTELDTRRRLTDAVLAGVSAGVLSVDEAGIDHAQQPLGARAPGAARGWRAGPAADRRDARTGAARGAGGGAARPRHPGPGRDPAARHPPHPAGPHQRRLQCRRRGHLRRRHRPDVGAAHGGLGRRGAAHRARDQEPADAHPAFRRAAEAPLPEADQGRSGDLLDLHRHHHPPGRRHRPHGRRVLVVRPHAAPDGAARGRQGALPAGAVPAAQRQSRDPLRLDPAGSSVCR